MFWTYEGINYLKKEGVKDHLLFGKQYNFISYVEGLLGHNSTAITYADSAIVALESLDTLTGDLLYSYQNKGQNFQHLGDFYRANVSLEQALAIAQLLNLSDQKYGILNDLGSNALHLGQLRQAETYFKTLLSDRKTPESIRLIAKANLTEVYLAQENSEKAQQAWKGVYDYLITKEAESNRLLPEFLQIKAHLLHQEGKQKQGIETLKKAISLLEQQTVMQRKAEKFRCDLAERLQEENLHEADSEIRRAYDYFNRLKKEELDPYQMVSMHLMASIFYKHYKASNQVNFLDSCLHYCKKTQELSDRLRQNFLYRNSKYFLANYLKANTELGVDGAAEWIKKGKLEQGQALLFYFMERGKSRVLLNELEEKQRALLEANGLLEKIYDLDLQRQEARDSMEVAELSFDLERLKSQLKSQGKGNNRSPYLSEPNLEKLCQFSKQSNVTFIEFGEGQNHLYALTVSGSQIKQRQITVSKDSLSKLIERYLSNLKNPTVSANIYASTAEQLYRLLIAPLNIQNQEVILVPSEQLAKVPFESLIIEPVTKVSGYKQLQYAINKWQFSYALSAAFLNNSQTGVKKSFCGILPVNQEEGDLSSHEQLLQSLLNQFQGKIFQKDSSISLAQLSKTHDFIHISSHGTFSEENPAKSFLYMPGYGSARVIIEQLYATAMLNEPFIVLNACETGEGKIRSGEGIDNFTRAFFYSGASGIIESSWKINASQTAAIFDQFYHSLMDGSSTKKALRTAQLHYLKDQGIDNHFAHPYYWAGFKHFGAAATLEVPFNFLSYWWLLGLGAIALLLFVLRKNRK